MAVNPPPGLNDALSACTYENLFVKIMGHASRDFRPVKAHGAIGDRKNDGFDSVAGAYYQVYSPEDVRKTQGDALKKLKTDFKGLKAFWDGIYSVKSYYPGFPR